MYVPKEQNSRENLLSKLPSLKKMGYNFTVILETLDVPSIDACDTNTIEFTHTTGWMMPVIYYLQSNELPEEEFDVRRIRKHVAKYTLMLGRLYYGSMCL